MTGATSQVAGVVAGSEVGPGEERVLRFVLQGVRVLEEEDALGCEGASVSLISGKVRRGARERGASGELILRTHPHHPRVLGTEDTAGHSPAGIVSRTGAAGTGGEGRDRRSDRRRTVTVGAVRRSAWIDVWTERQGARCGRGL